MVSTSERQVLRNAMALLEELIMNSDLSPEHLWAWALDERSLLFQTMQDIEYWLDNEEEYYVSKR